GYRRPWGTPGKVGTFCLELSRGGRGVENVIAAHAPSGRAAADNHPARGLRPCDPSGSSSPGAANEGKGNGVCLRLCGVLTTPWRSFRISDPLPRLGREGGTC